MTFSLLVYDQQTKRHAGIAATGAPCVGGWVLRGTAKVGISASQGAYPSTIWGEAVIRRMSEGLEAEAALKATISTDPNKNWRQLSCIDRQGDVAAHTGTSNTPYYGEIKGDHLIACGNLLTGKSVLDVLVSSYLETQGVLIERFLCAAQKAHAAGGDARGLQSAALLMVGVDIAPVTLRIDYAQNPVAALQKLYERYTDEDYQDWLQRVPTQAAPHAPFLPNK